MNFDQIVLDWNKVNGLMPCIVQDHQTGQVLMLGYMNKEALELSIKQSRLTFWSRTRQCLWQKGETSGNFLNLVSMHFDCDQDSLLARVNPVGPTCHQGTTSCFASDLDLPSTFLSQLQRLIFERKETRPEGSYTTRLFDEGRNKIAQKVGEEAIEVVIAALAESDDDLLNESADLVFHLMVLLEERGLTIEQVIDRLHQRNRAHSG